LKNNVYPSVNIFLDEETENGADGDDDKDIPIFYLSNEVVFTNQKMTRFNIFFLLNLD